MGCVGPVQVGDSYKSGLGRPRLNWGNGREGLGYQGMVWGGEFAEERNAAEGDPPHIGAFTSQILYTHILISLDVLNCNININIETDCRQE